MTLPELPERAYTLLGEVPVVRVASIPGEDGKASADMGQADFHARVISIREGLDPAAAWHTFFHEQAHFLLFDAGIKLRTNQEEAVCDAIATQRFQEMVTRRGV